MRRLTVFVVALMCAAFLFMPSLVIAEDGEDIDYAAEEQTVEETQDVAEESPADTSSVEEATPETTEETSASEDAPAETDAASDDTSSEDADEDAPRTVETETTVAEDDSKPALTEARAACVMDDSGTILYELNGEVEMDMASITKVMTAIVALDSGVPLDNEFSFVVDSYSEDAQIAGFQDGQMVSLADLLRVSLIYSGNDAATNVAYAVAGSEEAFVKLMNDKAAALGMDHTHFANPHGLKQDGHYSCAADLCKMGRYALEHYPFIREAVRTRSIDVMLGEALITLYSTDALMEYYDGLRGIKTGREATGCSFLGSARRNNVTLYSCVLCCDSDQGRFDDTEIALDWGFSLYDNRSLSRSGWKLRNATWQDGFWLKCPVQPTRNASGGSFRGKGIDFKTVMFKPNVLVGAQSAFGSTVWTQEGRTVGSTSYRAGDLVAHAPAWNAFVAPLFEDAE